MRENKERDEAIYTSFLTGTSKAEIARVENISATRVSQIIRRKVRRAGDTILSIINKENNHD